MEKGGREGGRGGQGPNRLGCVALKHRLLGGTIFLLFLIFILVSGSFLSKHFWSKLTLLPKGWEKGELGPFGMRVLLAVDLVPLNASFPDSGYSISAKHLEILHFELASWTHHIQIPGQTLMYNVRWLQVSVFLEFTIQCAFVRQRFVPALKEAHA